MRPPITYRLDGWEIFWAEIAVEEGDPRDLAQLRRRVADEVRESLDPATLASQPSVAAMRALFRAAGTDPTRYRPSSEALLRRLLKGDAIPEIHPLVDLNNCLSARLAVPCCVMAEGTWEAPFELRSGGEGESYESLRGPFRLAGRPLLVDQRGPCDTPITGSRRVKVTESTQRCALVAYLPDRVVSQTDASEALDEILATSGAARRI